MGGNRLILSNVNHTPSAQDLLHQVMAERGVDVAVVAEPYRVPPGHPRWVADPSGKAVAITWRHGELSLPCTFVEAGVGFVAVRWGRCLVVGVYIPPRLNRTEVERRLDLVRSCTEKHPWPVVVAGDFNAHSIQWGNPATTPRGRVVEEWAVSMGLILQNRGPTSTCVRPQGESTIDLIWAAPPIARRVTNCYVVTGVYSDSDHLYVQLDMECTPEQVLRHRRPRPLRWSLRALDTDMLEGALRAGIWPVEDTTGDPEAGARRLGALMTRACDCAMPRVNPRPRRAAYWWSQEIAELRQAANTARRRLKRIRRGLRHGSATPAEENAAANAMRDACHALRREITTAKARAWQELLDSVNDDPWGRPYKIVMHKIKHWAPPFTESMDPPQRDNILTSLFPLDGGTVAPWEEPPPPYDEGEEWRDEWGVSDEELRGAVKRMRAKIRAPGPSGIPGRAWAASVVVTAGHLRQLFTDCLRGGVFPQPWRRAKLVLLRKEGKPADSPSGYRPICLLDEEAKLFERIVAGRLVQHLEETGPGLHEHQFGFREGRSTIDAILRVRTYAERAVQEGRVAVCVSLDISNAFNTLPWDRIGGALYHHGVPPYLRRVLRGYFSDRWLEFRGNDGAPVERGVHRGVPQGSVLGPHLWNLGYNAVLTRAFLPPGCQVYCYADDTLIVATGDGWVETVSRANEALATVVRCIGDLGLEVAPQKTEAMFCNGLRGAPPPPGTHVRVSGVSVPVRPTMKYLGLTLDSEWSFVAHFEHLAPRVEKAANGLSRLLPNLGGPNTRVRRLFANVVHSLALYAAPVWAAEMWATPYIQTLMHRAHRRVAQRMIRGYRTTSYAVATALAGIPPLELLAKMHASNYRRIRELQEAHPNAPPRATRLIKLHTRRQLLEDWSQWLADQTSVGQWTQQVVAAIRSRLAEWAGRGGGGIPYRAAQILTGHGCFGHFLQRIGRDRTAECHHCGALEDTAWHTLASCRAWAAERRDLVAAVGRDLSPPVLIDAILGGDQTRRAVITFCEKVMAKKEDAERSRRGEDGGARRRRRPGGGARYRPPRLRAHMRPI